jgi:hypothetical protein
MLASTLLGKIPRHGGHGGGHSLRAHGGGGHAAHGGHGGHGGALKAIGNGGGHNAGGHSASGHSASAGHNATSGHNAPAGHNSHAGHNATPGHNAAAGRGSDFSHNVAANSPSSPLASTGPLTSEPSGIVSRALSKVHGLHVELKEESFIEQILGFFNPLTMATFMTFFGLSGAAASISLHLPEIFSIPIAIFIGWIAVQIMVHTIAWIFENMGSSTEAKVADFVGRMAEVSVPIDIGKVGEVIYIINTKRYASAAKSVDPTVSFTKRSKVMIAEVRDHLIMVEPWSDSFIDPDFDSPKIH